MLDTALRHTVPIVLIGLAATSSPAAQTTYNASGAAFVATNCCAAATFQGDATLDPLTGTRTGTISGSREGNGVLANCSDQGVTQSASVTGTATVAYGHLEGASSGSAANVPETATCDEGLRDVELESYGRVGQTLDFSDVVTVSSSTLGAGTAVPLTFRVTLDGAATYSGTDAGTYPAGAGVSVTGTIVAPGASVPMLGFNTSTLGFQEGTRDFTAHVGDLISVQGHMTVNATAATGIGAAASMATTSGDAHWYLTSSDPDVVLPSDSGHDYGQGGAGSTTTTTIPSGTTTTTLPIGGCGTDDSPMAIVCRIGALEAAVGAEVPPGRLQDVLIAALGKALDRTTASMALDGGKRRRTLRKAVAAAAKVRRKIHSRAGRRHIPEDVQPTLLADAEALLASLRALRAS